MSSDRVFTLVVKNVRLPTEAYRALNIGPLPSEVELPLVCLDYIHTQSATASPASPASSTPQRAFVEVYAHTQSYSRMWADMPFDPACPFTSVSDFHTGFLNDFENNRTRLIARFSTPAVDPDTINNYGWINAKGSLAIPGGLCHPHIHLDKPYLLDRCPCSSGTFSEALTSTASAKSDFTLPDLLSRGGRLISSSISHGVTSMRAFVEVDPTVGLMCVQAGTQLKKEFEGKCEVQLVAFAQDPIFYPGDKGKEKQMQRLMRQAAERPEVEVIGSAPYVETVGQAQKEAMVDKERKRAQKEQQRNNIDFIFDLAQEFGKHIDFHLDYDLDPPGKEEDGEESLIPYVLSQSQSRTWKIPSGKTRHVTLGHCTKLSSFTDSDLASLSPLLSSPSPSNPPISFVSLPPSDLYMQGRETAYSSRPRATIPILSLRSRPSLSSLNWAMGINNVANLFTPQGDADPMGLLPMMVGVWQSAKPEDCEVLVDAVSRTARIAAGLDAEYAEENKGEEGEFGKIWADLTILDGTTSVQQAACAPSYSRITIKDGSLVSHRSVQSKMY